MKLLLIAFLFLLMPIYSAAQSEDANRLPSKDRPVKIKKKPKISNSVLSKCFKDQRNVSAVVRLRATFHESGVITEVVVSQPSGCDFLDSEGIKSAKGIKFEPAIKNGQPATVVSTLEYRAGIGS